METTAAQVPAIVAPGREPAIVVVASEGSDGGQRGWPTNAQVKPALTETSRPVHARKELPLAQGLVPEEAHAETLWAVRVLVRVARDRGHPGDGEIHRVGQRAAGLFGEGICEGPEAAVRVASDSPRLRQRGNLRDGVEVAVRVVGRRPGEGDGVPVDPSAQGPDVAAQLPIQRHLPHLNAEV